MNVNELTYMQQDFILDKLILLDKEKEMIYYMNCNINNVYSDLGITEKELFDESLKYNFNINQIDEGIKNVIVLLNDKGYITKHCCEGHEPYYNGYISFINNYSFKDIPSCVTYQKYKDNSIRWKTNNNQTNIEILKELNEWVERL